MYTTREERKERKGNSFRRNKTENFVANFKKGRKEFLF